MKRLESWEQWHHMWTAQGWGWVNKVEEARHWGKEGEGRQLGMKKGWKLRTHGGWGCIARVSWLVVVVVGG